MTDDINSVFWCPQCGRGACSQEDGTCSVCGSDIILPQVVSAIARAAAEQEREACAVECVEVAEHYRKKCWDEAWEGAMDCAAAPLLAAEVERLRAEVDRLTRDRDRLTSYVLAALPLTREALTHIVEDRPEEAAQTIFRIVCALASAAKGAEQ